MAEKTSAEVSALIAQMFAREPAVQMLLTRIAVSRYYPAGCLLFRAGGRPEGIFILAFGHVQLSIRTSRGELEFSVAAQGSILGAAAAVNGTAHQMTATAVIETETLFLPRTDLLSIVDQCPEVALDLSPAIVAEMDLVAHITRRLRALRPKRRRNLTDASPKETQ